MAFVFTTLAVALFANATIAFGIAFFWQAKVILTIFGVSDFEKSHVLSKALGNQNSPQNAFGRFIAGEIFPELRRKWLKAIAYVAISFAALFLVAGLLQFFAPEYLP
ncbi:MAG: hypothetical protein ACSHXD_06990 [Marinosulfonomonas sp.]